MQLLDDVVWTRFAFMDLHDDVPVGGSSILHGWPVLGTFVLWREEVK